MAIEYPVCGHFYAQWIEQVGCTARARIRMSRWQRSPWPQR